MGDNLDKKRLAAVRASALRVGLTYLLAGIGWLALADGILPVLLRETPALARFQSLEGWVFLITSAIVVSWLVRREVRKAQDAETTLAPFGDQILAGSYVLVDGRFARVNERCAEIFGYTVDELQGMLALDLVVEDQRDRVEAVMAQREPGAPQLTRNHFTAIRKDGTAIDIEAFGRTIAWKGRTAAAGLVLDVTERMQLQEKLRQAARVDELGNLTGAVAHDFNNFLTGILGNLDLMLQDPEGGSPELRANLELVRESAARAASLTGQLLSFSRGGAFHHRPIDATRHLRELSRFLDSLCQNGQRVELDLEEDLPGVVLDPVALDQLVVNLFVNAKDAVGKRGNITIRTRSEHPLGEPPEVHIEVVDDGAGMSPAVQARIFEPFFTTKERGTGLGLATVRGIVDEVRGHLSVDSEPGRGTTVRVSFMAAAGGLAGGTEAPGSSRGATVTALAHPASTILVVDDDAAVRKVVSSALTRIGHRVLSAATGGEAERALKGIRGDVDLVICDVNLPDLSGPELVTRMRRDHADLLVLFTSGCRPAEEGEHGALLSAAPFLDKPFSLEELRNAVAETLVPAAEEASARESSGA